VIEVGNLFILILFVILRSVIGNLSSSQKKQTPPKQRRPQTKSKSEDHPFYPIPDFVPITVEEPIIKNSKPELSIKPIKAVKLSSKENRKEKLISDIQTKTDTETEITISDLITQDNILRGIILQEILSPPKAIAQRQR
jgi:hypothetical protein